MLLFCTVTFLLIAIQGCSGNRQQAADAIQQSLFGDAGGFEEREPEALRSFDIPSGRSAIKKAKGKTSYTFAELGQMNVKSAPRQQNFYRPLEYEGLPVIEACQAVQCHLSLVVVMDSSGSVGYQNYQTELSFVKTLLEILAVKAHDAGVEVCTGIVSYSTRVYVESDPCCGNSICGIVEQFNARRFAYRAGLTNTNGALKVARQMLQAAGSYKKVALLITDGKSNTGGSPVSFAEEMRQEDGILIVALGVTNHVNEGELKGISGSDLVTKISEFDEFHELATILLEANYDGSQRSFETICSEGFAEFQQTCSRDDEDDGDGDGDEDGDDEDLCSWGAWSNCVNTSYRVVSRRRRSGAAAGVLPLRAVQGPDISRGQTSALPASRGQTSSGNSRGNGCRQTRMCKLDGSGVKKERRECECPDLLSHSGTGYLKHQKNRRHPRPSHRGHI